MINPFQEPELQNEMMKYLSDFSTHSNSFIEIPEQAISFVI